MADTITPEAAAQARDTLMAEVYDRVYFGKLAGVGLTPRDEGEAQKLRAIGGRLYQAHQQKLAAELEKRGSLIDFAAARLDDLSGTPSEDLAYKQAAARFAQDPAVLAAAATLNGYLASA